VGADTSRAGTERIRVSQKIELSVSILQSSLQKWESKKHFTQTNLKACYSPELALLHKQIAAAALFAFQSVKDKLALHSYVVDFVYIPERDVCLIVELNHWSKTTSSSMFDWDSDIEVSVLQRKHKQTSLKMLLFFKKGS
jgi:hypothetical protein